MHCSYINKAGTFPIWNELDKTSLSIKTSFCSKCWFSIKCLQIPKKFSGNWHFFPTLVCLVERQKKAKKKKIQTTFHCWPLSFTGKNYPQNYTPRHTAKEHIWKCTPKECKKKFDIEGKQVLVTKPESLTFAICWMIALNSLTPRFGGKVDALGSGELQGVRTLPAATDLSANTSSPLLVKSKYTERSGGI